MTDTLPNCEVIRCHRCSQEYQFRYSNGEAHRLEQWIPKAQRVVNESHPRGHPEESLAVPW